MSYATIDDLRESLARPTPKVRDPGYVAKMMHEVPESTVVDRAKFVLERVRGKRVLEFGATGKLHDEVRKVASYYFGVDRESSVQVAGFDLDDVSKAHLPADSVFPEIILCGEVLEHLGNPQWFLTRLRRQYASLPVIITVPNALTKIGLRHIDQGTENVNIDHVAYYSYRTLRTLLERVGYGIECFHWYGGDPYTAEGLIVVTK